MLKCVGISLEKQQTWQDWLTISLSWDTTKRKPVSLEGCARLTFACRPPVRACWCWCYIAAVSFVLAPANSCNTGKTFIPFSSLLIMTEHSIGSRCVCVRVFAERFKTPLFCLHKHNTLRCFSWLTRNFPPPSSAFPSEKKRRKKGILPHPAPRRADSWQSFVKETRLLEFMSSASVI